MQALTFNQTSFDIIDKNNQIWLKSSEIAQALGYSDERSITNIYNRKKDEFTNQMTLVIKLMTKGFGNGNSEKETRIFSLRGAHLIAMFARTEIAKEFRKWVLDVLEHHTQSTQITHIQHMPKIREVEDDVLHTLFNFLFLAHAQAEGLKQLDQVLQKSFIKLHPEAYSLYSETVFVLNLKQNSLRELLVGLAKDSEEWQSILGHFERLKSKEGKKTQGRLALR